MNLQEDLKALRIHQQLDGSDRRAATAKTWQATAMRAYKAGIDVHRTSDQQYRIKPHSGEWMIYFYPGNCRIVPDEKRREQPPRIEFGASEEVTLDLLITKLIAMKVVAS